MIELKVHLLYKTKATFSVAFVLPRYLPASKIPTLKLSESKEVQWGGGLPVKAQLVKANNQRGASPPAD